MAEGEKGGEMKSYTIKDKRGMDEAKEVCRVCGSSTVHTRVYNLPTMKCILFLRDRIKLLEKECNNAGT